MTFKKDITDWFELDHTIDELLDLVARTEPTTKVPEPTLVRLIKERVLITHGYHLLKLKLSDIFELAF